MRRKVHENLDVLNHLSSEDNEASHMRDRALAVEAMMQTVADDYTNIMKTVSERCITALGEPKWKFCHVGMGSLACRSITPYSDFENAIILEDPAKNEDLHDIQEYFRDYAALFQMIVIGFKESPLRLLGIPCLNDFLSQNKEDNWFWDDFTPCGIQFDSNMPNAGKHPLGISVELIRTVSEMLEFVEGTGDAAQEGYLSDILTRTCYIAGHNDVFDDYNRKLQKKLEILFGTEERKLSQQNIVDDMAKCLTTFNLFSAIPRAEYKTDVKSYMYRGVTMFITLLGRLQNIEDTTCFGIIERLVLKEHTASCLRFAVALSFEVRIRTVMKAKQQDKFTERASNLIPYIEVGPEEERRTSEVWDEIEFENLIRFFEIVFAFQSELGRVVENWESDSDLKLWSITFGNQDHWLVRSLISIQLNKDEQAMNELGKRDQDDPNQEYISCHNKAVLLHKAHRIPEALETFQRAKVSAEVATALADKSERQCAIAWLDYWIGDCFMKLNQGKRAEDAFQMSRKICETLLKENPGKMDKHVRIVDLNCLTSLGNLYLDQKSPLALDFLMQAEEKCRKIHGNESTELLEIQSNIGTCYIQAGRFEKAYQVKKQVLDAYLNLEDKNIADELIVTAHSNIGDCLYELGRYKEASVSYQAAIVNAEVLEKHGRISGCDTECQIVRLARCENKLKNDDAALDNVTKALDLAQKCNHGVCCSKVIQCANVCLDIEMDIVERMLNSSQNNEVSLIVPTFISIILVYKKLAIAPLLTTAKLEKVEGMIHLIAFTVNSKSVSEEQAQLVAEMLGSMHGSMKSGESANKIAKIIGDFYLLLGKISKSTEWYQRGTSQHEENDLPKTMLELLDTLMVAFTAFKAGRADVGFEHSTIALRAANQMRKYDVIEQVIAGVRMFAVGVLNSCQVSSCLELSKRLQSFQLEMDALEPTENTFKSQMLNHNLRGRCYLVTQEYELAACQLRELAEKLHNFGKDKSGFDKLAEEMTVVFLSGLEDVLNKCKSNEMHPNQLDECILISIQTVHVVNAVSTGVTRIMQRLISVILNCIQSTGDKVGLCLKILDLAAGNLKENYRNVEKLIPGCVKILSEQPTIPTHVKECFKQLLKTLQSLDSELAPLLMLELSKCLSESDPSKAANLVTEAFFLTFIEENQDRAFLARCIHTLTNILTTCIKKGDSHESVQNAAEMVESTLDSLDTSTIELSLAVGCFKPVYTKFTKKCNW
ncbi:uncharacterized protein LOC104265960 [Ciona intestinalis]